MTHIDETPDAEQDPEAALCERILSAALAELTLKEIGAFTIEGVALRAGVDVQAVRERWPSANNLYAAALSDWGRRLMPIPDSGSLRTDWTEFSQLFVAAINSEIGRRVLAAVIVSPSDWDVAGIRQTFKEARTAEIGVMVQRAIERGECREGTDADFVSEVLTAGMSMPLIFDGDPLSDAYSSRIIDLLLEGVRKR